MKKNILLGLALMVALTGCADKVSFADASLIWFNLVDKNLVNG